MAEIELNAERRRENAVFAPHWPERLNRDESYKVLCDDKGREGRCWARVMVGSDSDAYLMAYEGCDQYGRATEHPTPLPGIRVRTFAGGGRNHRTHQALLWLALAIKLDNEENRPAGATPTEGRDG